MTSALEGGPQRVDERNKISRFFTVTGGEGVKKTETFADVIYGSPQRKGVTAAAAVAYNMMAFYD